MNAGEPALTPDEAARLAKVTGRVVPGEPLDPRRYHDYAIFEQERARLWLRGWHIACRIEAVSAPGDFVEHSILGKSAVVVHTSYGIDVFLNSCRHRAAQLAFGAGNCREGGISCELHSWKWNMDGENVLFFPSQIPDRPGTQAADLNLLRCRFQTWGGYVFVTFDDGAPPLRDALVGLVPLPAAERLEALRTRWWWSADLAVNWKSAMERLLETPDADWDEVARHSADVGRAGFDRLATRIELHATGRPHVELACRGASPDRAAFMFPNVVAVPGSEGVLFLRAHPLKPRLTRFEAWWLAGAGPTDAAGPAVPEDVTPVAPGSAGAPVAASAAAGPLAVGRIADFHVMVDRCVAGIEPRRLVRERASG